MKIKNVLSKKNRILLAELVRTDFRLRYQASLLGYLWSILNPLLLFGILYLVFAIGLRVGKGIEHFPVYLLAGIVLWRFFVEATNNGLRSIVQRGSLIQKINFPRYIIVISGTVSSLINLMLNLVVVLIFALANGVNISVEALLIVPLIIELYVFALAVAFLLAVINVRFRDVGYIWDIVLQAGFYATPIIYPLAIIAEKSLLVSQLLLLNPVAQVIQDSRYVLITHDSTTMAQLDGPTTFYIAPFLIIVLTACVSIWLFRARQSKFAEEV